MNTHRVQRVLNLLTLLLSGRAFTVDRLAEQLDVTRRTVFRDLSVLKQAGVPFEYDRSAKRYKLRRDCFLPPISFSVQECLALMFLIQKILQEGVAPDFAAASRAAIKLEGALPAALREHCQMSLAKLNFRMPPISALDGWQDHLDLLREAAVDQRKVQIEYEPPDKPSGGDCLHPYLITFLGRAWYVIGYSEAQAAVRTFKIERMLKCQPTEQPFVIERPFDLAEYLGNAWQMIRGSQRYRVRLEFTAKVATNVEEVIWHKTQTTLRTKDDGLIFEVDVDGIDEISWWVLGYGDQVKVLEPEILRDMVAQRARDMFKIYAGAS